MNSPCPISITCPGVDPPFLNFSSEEPDALVFSSWVYPKPDPPNCLSCPPINSFTAQDCNGLSYSGVSQEAADLLAKAAGVTCPKPQDQPQCTNEAQTATKQCPNGVTISYTVPAGSFVSNYTSSPAPISTPPSTVPPQAPCGPGECIMLSQGSSTTGTHFVFSTHNLTAGVPYLITVNFVEEGTGYTNSFPKAFTATGPDYDYVLDFVFPQTVTGMNVIENYPIPTAAASKSGNNLVITLGNLWTGARYLITWMVKDYYSGWYPDKYCVPGDATCTALPTATGPTMTLTIPSYFDAYPGGSAAAAKAIIVP